MLEGLQRGLLNARKISELSASPETSGRSGRILWGLLVLLILAASAGGFYALHKFKPRPEVKPPQRQIATVLAETAHVLRGGLPVSGNGLVQPRTEVVVSAEVSARVVAVNPGLVAGGTVREGEEMIRLDNTGFRASVSQGRADLTGALSSLDLARQSVRRTEELIKQGFLSRQTLDERIAAREQAEATVARMRAINEQQRINLSRTNITAPFNARVLSASVNAGDTVQPGRELARIYNPLAMEVAVSLTDRDMALINNPWGGPDASAGALVRVEHGGQRYEWDAVVDRVEAAIDPATRTFNVVVRLLEPLARGRLVGKAVGDGPPLLVGMYANVSIAGKDLGEYVTVPRNALRDGSAIWTITPEQTIRIVDVTVLAELDEHVALAKGTLTDQTRVITSDLKIVTNGMPVRVIGSGAPEKQTRENNPVSGGTRS